MAADHQTWRLRLPHERPPLSLNQQLHWPRRAELAATLRWKARILARQAKIPLLRAAKVTLVWQPTQHRNRDTDNPVATLKPWVDGLADAGVLGDDNSQRVREVAVTITSPVPNQPRVWLGIEEL